MKDRYLATMERNNPEEIKELLKEYRKALEDIQKVDNEEHEYNAFWLNKSTPIGLHLAMTLDELINVEEV